MSKFNNSGKDKFLSSIPTASLDLPYNNLCSRMRFNFSYFDKTQGCGLDLTTLDKDTSNKLLSKIIEYSREDLDHWSRTPIGSGRVKRPVYINYGSFPSKSDFYHPASVPHQALWGRFRLDLSTRLAGFVIPDEYHGRKCCNTCHFFDKNTFYVVFYDNNHKFYKTK